MALQSDTEIQYLKGVGEKRAALFHKLDIYTVGDLINYYPRSYIDFTSPCTVATAPLDAPCPIRATVLKKSSEQRIRKGLSIFKVHACDEDSATFVITFFNAKYTVDKLVCGQEYIFYGKLGGSLLKREMSSPIVEDVSVASSLVPIYALTAGITSRTIINSVKQAMNPLLESIAETLPSGIKKKYSLAHLQYAIENIHFPISYEALLHARRRLIFEELFILALSLSAVKRSKRIETVSRMADVSMCEFYNTLPFKLTNSQSRVISEIISDLTSGVPMNRLVQGDVGSGKTAVAAASLYFVARNGLQGSMMAPTEILAEQHFNTLRAFLEPLGLSVGIITGSMRSSEKNSVKKRLKEGEIDVIVGTHALISSDLEFNNLALVVTDEQHRFGVNQRIALSQKGQRPHTLVMSATPIPRTLALIIYGDLDVSIIDTIPTGRLPIKTYRIDSAKRQRAYGFIKKHLDMGLQCYIVCPLVEAGDNYIGMISASEYAENLQKNEFADYCVGLLHGKMKPSDKEKVMADFKAGGIQLLVATTVIEVGVDVPNAVIMLIENAERFGLGQLHQLRGRVGRGSEQSYCILLSDSKSPDTRARLDAICRTTSGFEIAEQDLSLRGPGDFFGLRQHGLPQLTIADMTKDVQLLADAQECARQIIENDPLLEQPAHREIRKKVNQMLREIGERPN